MTKIVDVTGNNGLVVGKKAMRVRGCPVCKATGKVKLGNVVTVGKIIGDVYVECMFCKSIIIVTEFVDTSYPKSSRYTYLYVPLPDLNDEQKTNQSIDKELTHHD